MPQNAHRRGTKPSKCEMEGNDILMIMYVPFHYHRERWKLTEDVSLLGQTGAGKSHASPHPLCVQ